MPDDQQNTEFPGHGKVIIPAADWDAFVQWLERPPEHIPALAKLFAKPTAWR